MAINDNPSERAETQVQDTGAAARAEASAGFENFSQIKQAMTNDSASASLPNVEISGLNEPEATPTQTADAQTQTPVEGGAQAETQAQTAVEAGAQAADAQPQTPVEAGAAVEAATGTPQTTDTTRSAQLNLPSVTAKKGDTLTALATQNLQNLNLQQTSALIREQIKDIQSVNPNLPLAKDANKLRAGDNVNLPNTQFYSDRLNQQLIDRATNGDLGDVSNQLGQIVKLADTAGPESVKALADGVRNALQARFGAEADFQISEPDAETGNRTVTELYPESTGNGKGVVARQTEVAIEHGGAIASQSETYTNGTGRDIEFDGTGRRLEDLVGADGYRTQSTAYRADGTPATTVSYSPDGKMEYTFDNRGRVIDWNPNPLR